MVKSACRRRRMRFEARPSSPTQGARYLQTRDPGSDEMSTSALLLGTEVEALAYVRGMGTTLVYSRVCMAAAGGRTLPYFLGSSRRGPQVCDRPGRSCGGHINILPDRRRGGGLTRRNVPEAMVVSTVRTGFNGPIQEAQALVSLLRSACGRDGAGNPATWGKEISGPCAAHPRRLGGRNFHLVLIGIAGGPGPPYVEADVHRVFGVPSYV